MLHRRTLDRWRRMISSRFAIRHLFENALTTEHRFSSQVAALFFHSCFLFSVSSFFLFVITVYFFDTCGEATLIKDPSVSLWGALCSTQSTARRARSSVATPPACIRGSLKLFDRLGRCYRLHVGSDGRLPASSSINAFAQCSAGTPLIMRALKN